MGECRSRKTGSGLAGWADGGGVPVGSGSVNSVGKWFPVGGAKVHLAGNTVLVFRAHTSEPDFSDVLPWQYCRPARVGHGI